MNKNSPLRVPCTDIHNIKILVVNSLKGKAVNYLQTEVSSGGVNCIVTYKRFFSPALHYPTLDNLLQPLALSIFPQLAKLATGSDIIFNFIIKRKATIARVWWILRRSLHDNSSMYVIFLSLRLYKPFLCNNLLLHKHLVPCCVMITYVCLITSRFP